MSNDINIDAFNTIFNVLKSLDEEAQKRTLQAIITFLNIPLNGVFKNNNASEQYSEPQKALKGVSFSENRSISPKEFLRDKTPKTEIERITCLAYYLTIYRDQPYFKTLDLSSLNTEAAQPKMSNPAVAVDNATKAGLLVQAGKGNKQISAAGELFVQALPDREAAKASISNMRTKKRAKKSGAQKNIPTTQIAIN